MGWRWASLAFAVMLLLGIASAQEIAPPDALAATPAVTPDAVHPEWVDFQPEFRPIICPFPTSETLDAEEFRCGYVLVPEDRTREDSRLIQLMVLKIAATTENPPGGAMIRLTGGPGGTSLSNGRIMAYSAPANASLREAADLIFFDQRGTGYSEGRFCRGELQAYQYGLPTMTDAFGPYLDDRRRCLAEARTRGVAVDGYTNWQNALDVRDIRLALGYENWTLFGVSYGTELAQGVMQVDPEGTRAAILDSVVPAGMRTNDMDLLLANGFRSALDDVDRMCAADAACAARFGDAISERFVSAIRAYDEAPIVLSGLSISRAATGTLHIDGSLAGSAVFQALYDSSIYGDLPALLMVLESRDEEALRAYVNQLGYPIDHGYGHGMAITINCRAGFREDATAPPPPGPDGQALIGLMAGPTSFQLCEDVHDNSDDPTARPLVSDIRTLIVTGSADPITPPYYADIALEGLSNAQRIDFPNTGHGALLSNFSACGRGLIAAFLNDPDTPLDAACAAETPAPDFLVNLRETKAPYRFGLKLQSQDYPVAPLAAGAALIAVMLGFLTTPIARRIDGDRSADYGRARIFTVLGGVFTLAGAAWAIRTILTTASSNFASLPVGVPASIGLAGWLGLAGFALCLVAVWRFAAARDLSQTFGTRLAILAAAIASAVILWFLFSIGAGPI